jgi:hypothetical protein
MSFEMSIEVVTIKLSWKHKFVFVEVQFRCLWD